MDEIKNTDDLERAYKCSSKIESCWNESTDAFDNSICQSDEHCSVWHYDDDGIEIELHGCILSRTCSSAGLWDGNSAHFSCPSVNDRVSLFVEVPKDYLTL